MNYNFPPIRTLDDVLPAIKGYDEFVVAEREYGTVVNYIIALKETFAGDGTDAAIRKECRGLIFDKDGYLISRPFHKFFNLGEREETFLDNLDLDAPYTVMEKLDGSMVRPVPTGEFDCGIKTQKKTFNMGTRMGVTDVAAQADAWLRETPTRWALYNQFFNLCYIAKVTPLFEWCSRQQRIVIDHPYDRMVLLAVRHNETGHYFAPDKVKLLAQKWQLEKLRFFDSHNINSILEEAKTSKEKMEGWVVRFESGHMVKVKLDTYVQLHKAKEAISREKYVIEAILDGFIDDLKSKLQTEDRERVEKFEIEFNEGLKRRITEMEAFYKAMRYLYPTKKDFALGNSPDETYKWKLSCVYFVWNGKGTMTEAILNTIRSHIKSQPDIDNNRYMWYDAKYEYGGQSVDVE